MRAAPPPPGGGAILPTTAAANRVRPTGFPQFPYFIAYETAKNPVVIDDQGPRPPADLVRLAWFITVLICLITVVILVLQGYLGYAAVTFAVAVSAAINLK
jgi:hypothetical protein